MVYLKRKDYQKANFLIFQLPPQIGILESYPDYLITLIKERLTLQISKLIPEEDLTRSSFKYQYFNKNIFDEYLRIINKNDLSNSSYF